MSNHRVKSKLVKTLIFCIALLSSGIVFANTVTAALSMVTFKRLAQVEALLQKEDFPKAQLQLDRLFRGLSRLSPSDQAYTQHMQALLHLYQQQYSLARKHFFLSYEQQGLDNTTRLQVVQMLAHLALHEEDFQQTIKFSKEYLAMAEKPSKTAYLILASAYYQLGYYAQAIAPLKQVINLFEPDRSAYSTLFAVYYQLKKLTEATEIIEQMIRLWPDSAEYWLQLASLYMEQDLYVKSLEIMQLSFTQGFLIRQNEFMQYIYALYDRNLPNKAAAILFSAMEKGVIKSTQKNYALLASLYIDAKEEKKALASYKKAAELSTDGKDNLFIAQIYYDQENYQRSIKHARVALKKGTNKPGNVHMLIAASYHELDNIPSTRKHLNKAVNYKESKKTANQWLLAIGDG